MKIALFKKRLVSFPTPAGWLLFFIIAGLPLLWWGLRAEAFLSLTERRPAEILVVEGWIGIDGIIAAKKEFEQGGYQYLVTTGGFSGNRWDSRRWNYATEANLLLLRLGMSERQVIEAAAPDSENRRTFGAASFAAVTLQKRQLHPANLNVFTTGAHARRSRLVYAKALGSSTTVGVISWKPPHYVAEPWWRSSERSLDLIKETVGYLFELFLNSGRTSNQPVDPAPMKT